MYGFNSIDFNSIDYGKSRDAQGISSFTRFLFLCPVGSSSHSSWSDPSPVVYQKKRNQPFQYSKTRLHAHICAHTASTRTPWNNAPYTSCTSLHHNHTCTTDPYHWRPNQTRTRTKQACTSWYKKVARAHTHTHTHTPLRPPHGESTEMCLKSGDEERPAECSPKWAARHNWYAL